MRPLTSILGLLLSFSASAATPTWANIKADAGWTYDSTMKAESGEIEVATRTIDGVACFRAKAKVAANPDKLLQVASDINGSKTWSSAGLAEAKLITSNGSALDYYQVLDVPGWTMASDRFWFLHGIVEKTPGNIVFRWERLNEGGPHNATWKAIKAKYPSAVEPPINVGGWVFSGTGTVDVRYFICTDSGGAIPQTLQVAATRRTLPATLDDLVKEARKR